MARQYRVMVRTSGETAWAFESTHADEGRAAAAAFALVREHATEHVAIEAKVQGPDVQWTLARFGASR